MSAQWDFTARHEGKVPHLYLDTRSNVTCGVGFLVPDLVALRKLPWSPNVSSAEMDWVLVRASEPGKAPSYYRALGLNARLSELDMRRMFDLHVATFRRDMVRAGWHLGLYPECVQVALVDMAFNLGLGGLNKYKRLRAAVEARDWARAADECVRGGVGARRNIETRQLFLKAVDEV